ncbi:MAG TPA: DUF1634 domain-containing protein [Planctomycetota bacterium]|jgi:uncharacterized membrane protein
MNTGNPPPLDQESQRMEKVRKVELVISSMLRTGVIISFVVVLTGMVLTFARHPQYRSSTEELARLTSPQTSPIHSVDAVIDGLRTTPGQAIVLVGLALLIATPVLRVAISIFAFVYEGDRRYVIITTIVLLLLLLSFVLGKVEG